MNTSLACLYTNKDARLREVPISERSESRRFECTTHMVGLRTRAIFLPKLEVGK